MSVRFGILSILERKKVKMNLDEYKQYVEAQRLSSLAIALEALTKSKAIQEKMKEGANNGN